MTENDSEDPLRMYLAFRQAVTEWMDDNAYRSVRPSVEHWPEGIESREEATEYYGNRMADEIIDRMDEILTREMVEDD